jgi:hypothetical protein
MTGQSPHDGRHEQAPLTQDQFDELVDDATHAVNNVIPDHLFATFSDSGCTALLHEINDSLTPILRTYVADDL